MAAAYNGKYDTPNIIIISSCTTFWILDLLSPLVLIDSPASSAIPSVELILNKDKQKEHLPP